MKGEWKLSIPIAIRTIANRRQSGQVGGLSEKKGITGDKVNWIHL